MENGSLVTFSMCVFTSTCDRAIKIMGTKGEIEGTMSEQRILYTPFGQEAECIDLTKLTKDFSGHGGGDIRMIQQFYEYVVNGEKSLLVTDLEVSLESHWIALVAEESRCSGGKVMELI